MIDTTICIYIMNNRPPEVIQKFKSVEIGLVGISSISVSELQAKVLASCGFVVTVTTSLPIPFSFIDYKTFI